MSPFFGYNLANYGTNLYGSSPELIMQIICDHGNATLQDMNLPASDYISWPSETAWKNAIPNRGNTSAVLDLSTDAGIEALKQQIANGDLAVIGVKVYDNFNDYPTYTPVPPDPDDGIDNNVLYANRGGELGGHALTVIGYDDNKTYNDGAAKNGAFLIVNSWGTSWGINYPGTEITTRGFIWISTDYVKNHSYYKKAYIMTDRNNYSSNVYGKFTIDHQNRGDLDVYFMGGDEPSNPDWSFNCLPYLGGDHQLNSKIVVDLGLYSIDYTKKFWLKVGDYNPSSATGQITFMSVERIDKGECTSADVPKNTINGQYVFAGMAYTFLNPSFEHILTYPNPFNLKYGGTLRFAKIPVDSPNVEIFIYNVAGELIRTLKEGMDIQTLPDSKIAVWDGTNDAGNKVASGVYIWLAKSEGNKSSGKIALIR